MKGPDLSDPSTNKTVSHSGRAKKGYGTIQVKGASSRSADISGLDPKLRYLFRVVPIAGRRAGQPSEEVVTGPGEL